MSCCLCVCVCVCFLIVSLFITLLCLQQAVVPCGGANFTPLFRVADKKVCASVCRQYGLHDDELGVVLRGVVIGANMRNSGGAHDWCSLELIKLAERAPDGSLQLNEANTTPTKLHVITCRGGKAMESFPTGLNVLDEPEHNSFKKSPWGVMPKLKTKLSHLSSRSAHQSLKHSVNALMGWEAEVGAHNQV
jgi:hypothetical protein